MVSDILRALACEDIEYSGFCTKIRELAARNDDEVIMRFIELLDRKACGK